MRSINQAGSVYLTKQSDKLRSALETDAGIKMGVPQIEVTPEMITAGSEILLAWAPDVMSPTIAYGLAEDVIARALSRAHGRT